MSNYLISGEWSRSPSPEWAGQRCCGHCPGGWGAYFWRGGRRAVYDERSTEACLLVRFIYMHNSNKSYLKFFTFVEKESRKYSIAMKIWKLNEVFLYLYFVKIRYSTLSLCTAVQTYAPKIEFKKDIANWIIEHRI